MSGILLLLAEDDVLILSDLEDALKAAGFDVLAATTGTQAQAYIKEDAARFRGLITDIDLSRGPTGWDLAHQVREQVAAMPVVYVSGAHNQDWASKGVPNSLMIAKPYATVQVITAIAQLMNESSSSGGLDTDGGSPQQV